MQEQDESVRQVEQNLNQRLRMDHRLKQGLGLVFHPVGRHYTRLKSNIWEGVWLWFTVHKGYRFVFLLAFLLIALPLAYYNYPELLIDVLISPVVAIIAFPFAREAARRKEKVVHAFRRQKRVYPVGMKFDDLDMKIEPIMFEDNVTGHHAYKLIDEAISESPKPDSVQIMGANAIRDYVTNREELVIEYVSPDGKFAAGNPYSGYSNLTLLEIAQKPKFYMAKKFEKLLTDLDKLPKDDFEKVAYMKQAIWDFKKKLNELQEYAVRIQDKASALGIHLKKIGDVKVHTEKFLTHYADWKDAKILDYIKFRETPESAVLPAYIEKMNNGTTNMYTLQTIWLLMNEIQDRSDMKARDVRRKINKVSAEELLKIANSEAEKLGSSVPPTVEKQVFQIEKEITEEEEEDEWK